MVIKISKYRGDVYFVDISVEYVRTEWRKEWKITKMIQSI